MKATRIETGIYEVKKGNTIYRIVSEKLHHDPVPGLTNQWTILVNGEMSERFPTKAMCLEIISNW